MGAAIPSNRMRVSPSCVVTYRPSSLSCMSTFSAGPIPGTAITTFSPGDTAPLTLVAALAIESREILMVGPACVTEKLCPPTATVPVRGSAPPLASAEMPTTPGPDPEAPVTIVIHDVVVVVDHTQLAGVDTLKVTAPPPTGTFAAPGVSAIEHASASCATVNVWPATVMELARASPLFGSSANDTCPVPDPEGLERMR